MWEPGDRSDDADLTSRPSDDVIQVLVANHRQFLGFLEKRVDSRAVAEDILQEAFVRGMNKLQTLRSDESIVAWFYRVLRNAVIDHYRRDGAAQRSLAALGREMEGQSEPSAELRSAICQCVSGLAGALKPEYAAALRSIELGDSSLAEYASQAGISVSNAGVRVARARKALREQVMRSCGTCAEHGCYDCTCDQKASGCGSSAGV
jgi:RNA polymerase sigma factor (sigma-70 family)